MPARPLLILALLCGGLAPAAAAEHRPVPAVTIYPGDTIREEMLADQDFPESVASSAFVTNRSALVGKVARRTLLPGQAIPVSAVGEPRLVRIGALVRVVYKDDGLVIQTYAAALQNGAAGDVVAVRNSESGVTISGIVEADGSVHVGGG
ncbi:Flagella basal body P-ring formation protein FlgA [Beijerinckiaceae bacterium RH AL1]|jgi:flagellar basal body P-ring formation protein FlgA|nr:flagellar basal body P-ring formation chaperone FlgA [Beijerinckiaceae bacterium]VVB47919.1 Flagella basal body P-ring formation protein FlgA [Beijerinckiaceae bacterium RH CH11]VVB47996.1 Flagella basal body P-ring formation protein FlgA [Beijerinckiaceae bacterium RH AL8]VVC56131.1 Flagella basal body P-ring formation protein FlgA [Beijerinckiaceae bacterium RH AL1]